MFSSYLSRLADDDIVYDDKCMPDWRRFRKSAGIEGRYGVTTQDGTKTRGTGERGGALVADKVK